jgi:hypothetical protein
MVQSIRRLRGPNAPNPSTRVIAQQDDNTLILNLNVNRNQNIVSVCTAINLPQAALDAGLVADHAYAVTDWDPRGTLTLRNPWNDNSRAGGIQFQVRLADFRQWFTEIASDNWLTPP